MHEIKNGMTFYLFFFKKETTMKMQIFFFFFEMNAQNLKMESGAGDECKHVFLFFLWMK